MPVGWSRCPECGDEKMNLETHEQHRARELRKRQNPAYSGVPVYTSGAPRADGMRVFGNRLQTLEHLGRNTFAEKRAA